MTSKASFSDDLRMMKKSLPKSLLLRDYLLDDMSSCSSNGFRSYPRRQCCTTVRFLVELDLNKHSKLPTKRQTKPKSKSRPKQRSVMQRASAVMINAFKHFPFAGKVDVLPPRSPSRKLFGYGFWKKMDHHKKKDIRQLKSFGDLIKEKETETTPPPHHKMELKSFGDLLKEKETETTPPPSPSQFSTVATTSTATAGMNISMSSSNSNSWSDSDLTATTDSFNTGYSSEINSSQNDVVGDLEETKQTSNKKMVGTTTTTAANYPATTDNTEKKWQNENGEQLSPVSVMDFPCDNDNDEVVSYVFRHRRLDVKGNKKALHKVKKFEADRQLEPVKLEDRITQSIVEETCFEFVLKETQVEKRAATLLDVMTLMTPCHHLFKFEATKNLLLGFFIEKMTEENMSEFEMLQTTKDWMDGEIEEMFLDWGSYTNRQTYVREIEKKVKWSKYDDEVEKENVGLELEHEIFSSLVNDMLLDFHLAISI